MFRFRCDSKIKNGMIEAITNIPIIPPVTRTRFSSLRLKTIQRIKIVASQAMAAVQKKKYEKTRMANRAPANNEYATRDRTVSAVKARHTIRQKMKKSGKIAEGS